MTPIDKDEQKLANEKEPAKEPDNVGNHQMGNRPRRRFFPVGWSKEVLGLESLTVVLCVIGFLQAWAFITSERAFVAPDLNGVKFAQDILPNVPRFEMILEMRNSGKNTATIQSLDVVITHGPLSKMPPPFVPHDRRAFPPIIPNGTAKSVLKFDIGKNGWDEQIANGVRTGTLPFIIYGRVKYTDVFSWPRILDPKETGFCFVYSPSYPGGPTFVTCPNPEYTY